MAPTKSKGPKIANPAKAKGKSRATDPKPAPAAIPKAKKADNKPPAKKADKNPPTKKAPKAGVNAGSSSTAKRSSPATLFEDDEELLLPHPLKRRKPMPTPTPEPEPEGSVVNKKFSSPLSSPSPSPPRKRHTPAATSQSNEAGDIEDEVLGEAEEHEDAGKLHEEIGDDGSNDAQPEDEGEEAELEDRDQDNTEGEEDEDEDDLDQFQDPEATAYALSAALGFTTEAEKVAYARYLQPFYNIAHITPRAINPFLAIGSTLETAMRLDPYQPYVQQSAEAEIEELNEAAFTHTMQFYKDFVGFCPHILKVMHASKDDPGLFGALCKYMDQLAGAARRVDCNRIRTTITSYIPDLPKNVTLRKEERGWLNEHTARLLCPQSKLKDFNKDWKVWTQKVKQGNVRITEFDLPSFLWDQSVVDPDDITVGLLRGPILLSCFRIVFTGPRTGDSEEPGMKPGKPCFMQMYNMQTVLAQMIAYIAVLIRFALNRQRSWHNHDNDFNSKEFFNAIVSLFCSDEEGGTAWSVEIMEWWNLQVLSVKPREFRGPSEDSEYAMIRAMFAARASPATSDTA